MKSRQDDGSSYSGQNQEQEDCSVLRKPIFTSSTGFLETLKAYENGTEEVRRLISRECDLMYECKICRNVFRSFTNFISHKRVYCREQNNLFTNFSMQKNGFIDQDISTIIEAEEEYVKKNSLAGIEIKNQRTDKDSKKIATSKTNHKNDKNNKDLSSIIEKLSNRDKDENTLKLRDYYDQVHNKLTHEQIIRKNHVLHLDRVPNSKIAVYQTVKRSDSDNIKIEVNEIHDLLLNKKTVLGPDGKIIPNVNVNQNIITEKITTATRFNDIRSSSCSTDVNCKILQNEQNLENNMNVHHKEINNNPEEILQSNFTCEICDNSFKTDKTLKLHLQTKHITSTFVYQCPSCTETFLKPSAVIRHLTNDHKKSMRRIRVMRETIHKRRIRINEVQVKPPNRELARLQTDQERREADQKAWLDNIERSPTNSPFCLYCGKKFERRAVLTTHLNNCAVKNRQTPPNLPIQKKVLDVNQNSTSQMLSAVPSSNTLKQILAINSTVVTEDRKHNSSMEQQSKLNGERVVRENIKVLEKPKSLLKPILSVISSIEVEKSYNLPIVSNSGPIEALRNNSKRKKKNVGVTTMTKKKVPENNKAPENNEISNNKTTDPTTNGTNGGLPVNGELKEFVIVKSDQVALPDDNKCIIPKLKLNLKLKKNRGEEIVSEPILKKNNNKLLKKVLHEKKDLTFFCRICKKSFSALSNLRRHISMFHYRMRKFGCQLCEYRAFRKYDVVNHLSAVHSIARSEKSYCMILVNENQPGREDVNGDVIVSENGILHNGYYDNCAAEEEQIPLKNEANPQNAPGSRRGGKKTEVTKNTSASESADSSSNLGNFHEKTLNASQLVGSSSNLSYSSNEDTSVVMQSKRPIRNRIKPVKKDFVYDLSVSLKKDMAHAERESLITARAHRRRNISLAMDESSVESVSTGVSSSPPDGEVDSEKIITTYLVKGAAQEMARKAVSQAKACFNAPPELPTERQFISSATITNQSRPNSNSKISIVTSNNEDDNIQGFKGFEDMKKIKQLRVVSDDTIIRNLSKKRKNAQGSSKNMLSEILKGENTQYLEMNNFHKTAKCRRQIENLQISSLDHEPPMAQNVLSSTKVIIKDENSLVKCSTDIEFQEYLTTNKLSESVKIINVGEILINKTKKEYVPVSSCNSSSSTSNDIYQPSSNPKRITLLQRLAENQNKKIEQTLLRSALEK